MDRGVVVGGLMICGSFLLAASLNRSAVNEKPPAPAAVEATIVAPAIAPLPAAPVVAKPASCADVKPSNQRASADERERGELPGNGREGCSQ